MGARMIVIYLGKPSQGMSYGRLASGDVGASGKPQARGPKRALLLVTRKVSLKNEKTRGKN